MASRARCYVRPGLRGLPEHGGRLDVRGQQRGGTVVVAEIRLNERQQAAAGQTEAAT